VKGCLSLNCYLPQSIPSEPRFVHASMLFLFSFVLSFLPCFSISNFPVVSTSYGSIRGYEYTTESGFTAQIFKKLPFASPPIGDLRWAKPLPPHKWNETIDGTFFGPACAQRTLRYSGPVSGFSEDCLHINIYTSDHCISNSSCPVLFLIHGGLGIYEAPMKFPDQVIVTNFVSQDIVVVSTAYRLGAFGVMALGDENEMPANLLMHDVLAALKFTRSEIHAFGGDKERITLMGHSTGGQMALLLAFSPGISPPEVPHLFSSVISMSAPSGFESMELQVQRTHNITDKLNCSGTAREIVACMRRKTSDEILNVDLEIRGTHITSEESIIGIVMGGELLPITNSRELREKNQPLRLMIGTTLNEVKGTGSGNKVNKVVGFGNDEECYEKYLDDINSGKLVTEHNTDAQAIIMTAHLMAKAEEQSGGEVYLYEYDYPVHAMHTDDAFFVLGFHEFEKDSNEEWLSRVYPRYFANFVNGRRPAPDWYRLKPHLMNYYSVNRNETSGVSPLMKFGYQHEISDYYDEMIKFDQRLSEVKGEVSNRPIEYH
ncbi:hypothetical protein PENTCL1PPCAC_26605, partial [Pristionchus entomophagus]